MMMQLKMRMPWLQASLSGVLFVMAFQAFACGLEPSLKGGFTVSYPGSLDVAVAVARARDAGALPPIDPAAVSNDVLLREMIADLRRLQSRLKAGRVADTRGPAESFSLVLVGPGLWSHFYVTPANVLGRYHVDGPLEGKVVVLTHHYVLEALLQGSLTAEAALDRGLLAFSGDGADSVRRAFIAGLGPRA
jgi:hypothetical protein